MKTLAENIRTARRYNGWTQEELAQRAGVSQTTIDKIEQGKTLKSRFLPNIALALNAPLEFLDPEIAKATQDWNTRCKNSPESFYQQRPDAAVQTRKASLVNDTGLFRLGDPIYSVPVPRWVHVLRCISIEWTSDLMSPEFDAGDVLVFEEGAPLYAGKTGIFISSSEDKNLYMIGRLLIADEEYWKILLLKHNVSVNIPTKEWATCAPLKTRYCVDPGPTFPSSWPV